MALRARSMDLASITSARANSTITMAASGHCPIRIAPVTAMLIKALILRFRFLRAIQHFLLVEKPPYNIASIAKDAGVQGVTIFLRYATSDSRVYQTALTIG